MEKKQEIIQFVDGNLNLDVTLSNGALVAITLMIACSRAEEKDIFVDIVINLLLEK